MLFVVLALPEIDYTRPLRYETEIAPEEAEKASGSTDGGLQAGKEVTIRMNVEATSEHEEQLSFSLNALLPCRGIHRQPSSINPALLLGHSVPDRLVRILGRSTCVSRPSRCLNPI